MGVPLMNFSNHLLGNTSSFGRKEIGSSTRFSPCSSPPLDLQKLMLLCYSSSEPKRPRTISPYSNMTTITVSWTPEDTNNPLLTEYRVSLTPVRKGDPIVKEVPADVYTAVRRYDFRFFDFLFTQQQHMYFGRKDTFVIYTLEAYFHSLLIRNELFYHVGEGCIQEKLIQYFLYSFPGFHRT